MIKQKTISPNIYKIFFLLCSSFCLISLVTAQEIVMSEVNEFSYEAALSTAYYESLIEKAIERHWAVPLSFGYTCASRGFDCDSQNSSLEPVIFGQSFSLQDIYLFAKLSKENKINRDGELRAPERFDAPIPTQMAVEFGGFSDDLFTTLLADTQIQTDGHFYEFGVEVSTIYYFTSKHFTAAVGAILPFKTRQHELDVVFVGGGGLFREGPNTQGDPISTRKRDMLKDFFRDYSSLDDFFQKAVLDAKNLELRRVQRKSGVGDISLFGLIDIGQNLTYLESLQLGGTFVLPTGGKADGSIIWEPILGNGGAFQIEFFTNLLFDFQVNAFNPTARLAINLSAPFMSNQRVPNTFTVSAADLNFVNNQVQELVQVNDVLGFDFPTIYSGYHFTQPFDAQLSSSVLYFADRAVRTKIRCGTRLLFGIGNYFYNTFNLGFRLGVFYDYMHKSKDSVCVQCAGDFEECILEKFSEQRSHTISWNLTYKLKNMIELNVGTQHIVAGKNVPRIAQVFTSIVLVF